jgi:hypothetical protein
MSSPISLSLLSWYNDDATMRSMRDNTTSWGDLVNINDDDNLWNQPFATNLGEYNSEWYNTSRLTVDEHAALIAWMRAHNWEIEEISFDSVKAFPFEPVSKAPVSPVANVAPVAVVAPVVAPTERELLAVARAIAHEQAVARNAEIEARKIALAAAGQPINRKEKRAAAAAAAAALAASK